MPFDLSTAQPVTSAPPSGGGFNLATAVPVNPPPAQQSTLDSALATLNRIGSGVMSAGPLETATHVASGAVGGLGGGLTYLGTLAASGDLEAAKAVQEATQQALTYQPRTKEGKAIAKAADKALGLIPEGLNKAGEATTDAATKLGASPAVAAGLGTAVNTGGNAALQLAGLRGILKGGATGLADDAADTTATAPVEPKPAPATPAELTQQSLDSGTGAGYQLTPNYNPNASTFDRLMQGLGGKATSEQAARLANQNVTNQLAAKALGKEPSSVLTPQILQEIRQGAIDQGYKPIENLSGTIDVDGQFLRNIAQIKAAHGDALSGNPDVAATADILLNPNGVRASGSRAQASTPTQASTAAPRGYLDSLVSDGRTGLSTGEGAASPARPAGSVGFSNADPLTLAPKVPYFDPATITDQISTLRSRAQDAYAAGRSSAGAAFKAQASELEALLDRNLQDSDSVSPETLNQYRAARQLIAKTHAVQEALNPSTGNVDATALATALKGGAPLTGELKTIADFANAAPAITKLPAGGPMLGSPLGLYAGVAGAHATGGLSLIIPAARSFATNWLLKHKNPATLQPSTGALGQAALDAVHGSASAFQHLYSNSGGTIATLPSQADGYQPQ